MNLLLLGSISACFVIILGAFGAHGLKNILDQYATSIYNKAVLYHMFHTIGILVLGLIEKVQPDINLSLAGLSFIMGIFLFSGSLYLLAVTSYKSLGVVTPIGGVLFIIGWILFAIKISNEDLIL